MKKILLGLGLVLLVGCGPVGPYTEKRTNVEGIDCVVARSDHGVALSCDWRPK